MRYPASEKAEIIRLVEASHLPARHTLATLGIPRTTFYRWYDRYRTGGIEALADHRSRPDRVRNGIPETIRAEIVELALRETELSPRELAVRFTDEKRYFVSEASVYRLLKAHDLIDALFDIEHRINGLSAEERRSTRREQSSPSSMTCTPGSASSASSRPARRRLPRRSTTCSGAETALPPSLMTAVPAYRTMQRSTICAALRSAGKHCSRRFRSRCRALRSHRDADHRRSSTTATRRLGSPIYSPASRKLRRADSPDCCHATGKEETPASAKPPDSMAADANIFTIALATQMLGEAETPSRFEREVPSDCAPGIPRSSRFPARPWNTVNVVGTGPSSRQAGGVFS